MTVQTKFAHLADIHLGNQQYDLPQRFDDFGEAWKKSITVCVEEKVDFVLVAGDLFHKRAVEPRALLQAEEGLQVLRRAKIPVIAVEGNHDRTLFGEEFNWMEYLNAHGWLTLLRSTQKGSRDPDFRAYDPATRTGSYFDQGGVRIVGVPYLGAGAADFLYRLSLKLGENPFPGYVILMAHAGLDGVLPTRQER
jgi:DNA repair protein SbcD/Mre11